MGNLATNPLILLLLGTALSAYLIPKFVGQSQDRQKELDLKSNLVSSLSDHSSSAISSFAVLLSSNNPDYLAYENAYRSWVENSQADKSKVAAYFPAEGEADLEKTWQQYMVVVNQFYIILDCRDFNLFRPEGLGLIQTNLRAIERSELAIAKKDSFTPGRVRRSWRGWKILQPCYQPATFGSQYEKYSLQLRDEILNGKDAAIQEILASSMPAYATHWP